MRRDVWGLEYSLYEMEFGEKTGGVNEELPIEDVIIPSGIHLIVGNKC